MPTKTQQAVVLLSLFTAALIIVKESDLIDNDELKAVVDLGLIRMWEIVEEYPSEGIEDAKETIAIHRHIASLLDKAYTPKEVVYLGHRICGDLLMELCNPVKRQMVMDANAIITRLNDFLDPDGTDEETHDSIDKILDVVYRELGFTIEHRYLKHYRKLQRRLKNNVQLES